LIEIKSCVSNAESLQRLTFDEFRVPLAEAGEIVGTAFPSPGVGDHRRGRRRGRRM